MFFETHGLLLRRAAEALLDEVAPALGEDPETCRKLDAIAQFVGETGCLWTDLFVVLERENEILIEALDDASAALRAPRPMTAVTRDPLSLHAALIREVSLAVDDLHDRGDLEDTLTRFREAIHAATTVETAAMRAARARWKEQAAVSTRSPLNEGMITRNDR